MAYRGHYDFCQTGATIKGAMEKGCFMYQRVQNNVDVQKHVFWVKDVCFEESAVDPEITAVFDEVAGMDVVPPALMTRRALCLYINAPAYVQEHMAMMAVGSSFVYDGIEITRWSSLTYNGRRTI